MPETVQVEVPVEAAVAAASQVQENLNEHAAENQEDYTWLEERLDGHAAALASLSTQVSDMMAANNAQLETLQQTYQSQLTVMAESNRLLTEQVTNLQTNLTQIIETALSRLTPTTSNSSSQSETNSEPAREESPQDGEARERQEVRERRGTRRL